MAQLTYSLNEQQFCNAQRLHFSFRPRWLRWVFTLVGILGLPILGAGLYHHNVILSIAGFLYSSILLLHIPAVARLAQRGTSWLMRPRLVRTFRRSPSLHQQSHVELRDGVMHLRSDNGQGVLPWEHIIHWAEDDDSVLLYLQPRLFIIVPKEVDPKPSFIAALREQLLTHVGPARRQR